MNSRFAPVVIAIAVFVVAALVGRYLILPALHGHTVTAQQVSAPADQRLAAANQMSTTLQSPGPSALQNMSAFDECMKEALDRRVDPIEARHTCAVIADNI